MNPLPKRAWPVDPLLRGWWEDTLILNEFRVADGLSHTQWKMRLILFPPCLQGLFGQDQRRN